MTKLTILAAVFLILLLPNTANAYQTERVQRQQLANGNVIEYKVTKRGYQSRTIKPGLNGNTYYTYQGKRGYGTVKERTNLDGSVTRSGDLKTEKRYGW